MQEWWYSYEQEKFTFQIGYRREVVGVWADGCWGIGAQWRKGLFLPASLSVCTCGHYYLPFERISFPLTEFNKKRLLGHTVTAVTMWPLGDGNRIEYCLSSWYTNIYINTLFETISKRGYGHSCDRVTVWCLKEKPSSLTGEPGSCFYSYFFVQTSVTLEPLFFVTFTVP